MTSLGLSEWVTAGDIALGHGKEKRCETDGSGGMRKMGN